MKLYWDFEFDRILCLHKSQTLVYYVRMNTLLTTLQKRIPKIAKKYDLDFVVLFGSQATKKTHPESDVDLAFSSSNFFPLEKEIALSFDLSQSLQRADIDLVQTNHATPTLMRQISREGVVLYQKEPSLFAQFQMYAFKYFIEAKPLLSLRKKSLKQFLQRV